jgi:hypothetical protein
MGETPVIDRNLLNQLSSVFQARQQVTPDFMQRQNVVACGVGYKISGQQLTSTPSVVVSVVKKLPVSNLSPDDLIPKTINDIPTDVVETGLISALGVDRTARYRPVRPGISIGHVTGSTGTLGCIVQRGSERFILSNNHVLARLNEARPGDAIIQPGQSDGGQPADVIGQLAEFIPIAFLEASASGSASSQATSSQGGLLDVILNLIQALLGGIKAQPQPVPPMPPQGNRLDAALVRPLNAGMLDPSIIDVGAPPLGFSSPTLGMKIVKSGRTTGVTEGLITQLDVTVDVRYGERTARFVNQIMATPFSKPGDSGSLVLDFERKGVGLLFSGSDQISVINPLAMVLSALKVDLVTASGSAAPPPDFG